MQYVTILRSKTLGRECKNMEGFCNCDRREAAGFIHSRSLAQSDMSWHFRTHATFPITSNITKRTHHHNVRSRLPTTSEEPAPPDSTLGYRYQYPHPRHLSSPQTDTRQRRSSNALALWCGCGCSDGCASCGLYRRLECCGLGCWGFGTFGCFEADGKK